ncbi:hypothetical protein BDZ89DRAFT_1073211 [Hymenopellis radicata]|nr:hypothetical protein BDZ89DRAFT_1073211 [Hymenopellis radicata]
MTSMYSNLLAHLQQPTSSVGLETIQGALSHHLAHLSPLPTPLAASAVSAPLFLSHPLTLAKLDTLSTAFRHAVHIKYDLLTKDAEESSLTKALFTRGPRTRLGQWVGALINGLQGGQPIMRLACSTGILMGMNDFEKLRAQKGPAENEVVLSLAEVMDLFRSFQLSSASSSEWEKEFQPMGDHDLLSAALILSSQSLPLVVEDKLKALPLDILGRLLTSTISSAFTSGTFLTSPSALVKLPLLASVAPLSKLSSLTHSVLLDSRPRDGLVTSQETLSSLEAICAQVEMDWNRVSTPADAQRTWLVLKTLLFSTIMISESVLSAAIYVTPCPAPLGLTALRALGHLSFVIQQFGGITPSSNFVELKKAVYLALDVVAGSTRAGEAEDFVSGLLRAQSKAPKDDLAKKAFILACAEQLVPVLKDPRDVFALCEGHLNSPEHRETYESAHSVVLAVLSREDMDGWVSKMVPWYSACLVENSAENGLDTVQLRLAFQTLVKSACRQENAIGWFPVEELIRAIEKYRDDHARAHRLRLALISSVSAVRGVDMLSRILKEVRRVIKGKQEVERLGEEVIERVGDREKAFAIRWWAENRKRLEAEYGQEERALARL